MLTVGSSAVVTARISMFRILAAPHVVGLFCFVHLSQFRSKSVTGTRLSEGTCHGFTGKT